MVAQGYESYYYPSPAPAPAPAPSPAPPARNLTSFFQLGGSMDSLDEIFPTTPTKKSTPNPSSPISIASMGSSPLEQDVYESLNEEEKLELTLLISEQEFLYGVNMLEGLSTEEFQDAKRISTLQGVQYYKALRTVFNNKMSPLAERSSSPNLKSSSSDSNSSNSSSPKKVRFSDCTKDNVKTSKPKRVSKRAAKIAAQQQVESEVKEDKDEVSSWAVEMQRMAFQSFEEQKMKQQQQEQQFQQLRRIQSDEHMIYASSPIAANPRRTLHRTVSDGFYQPHAYQAYHSQYYPHY